MRMTTCDNDSAEEDDNNDAGKSKEHCFDEERDTSFPRDENGHSKGSPKYKEVSEPTAKRIRHNDVNSNDDDDNKNGEVDSEETEKSEVDNTTKSTADHRQSSQEQTQSATTAKSTAALPSASPVPAMMVPSAGMFPPAAYIPPFYMGGVPPVGFMPPQQQAQHQQLYISPGLQRKGSADSKKMTNSNDSNGDKKKQTNNDKGSDKPAAAASATASTSPAGTNTKIKDNPAATAASQSEAQQSAAPSATLQQQQQAMVFPPVMGSVIGVMPPYPGFMYNPAATAFFMNNCPPFMNMMQMPFMPIPARRGICLALRCDSDQLSDYQIIIRQQLEIFEASPEDIESNTQGRKKRVVLGQVGLRCRHCAGFPLRDRGRGAVYYPAKLDSIYQAAQNMAGSHLCKSCRQIPPLLKSEVCRLRERRDNASGGKQYWADGCRVLGIYETEHGLKLAAQPPGGAKSSDRT